MLELLKKGYTLELTKEDYYPGRFKIENGVIMCATKALSGINNFIPATWMDEKALAQHLKNMAKEGFTFTFTPSGK